jgi:hypothetical protein
MAAATKKRKEKKKFTLGWPALVAGTQQTLSNLFWRLAMSMSCWHVRFSDNSLSMRMELKVRECWSSFLL